MDRRPTRSEHVEGMTASRRQEPRPPDPDNRLPSECKRYRIPADKGTQELPNRNSDGPAQQQNPWYLTLRAKTMISTLGLENE